jgi:riboflavin synthase
VKALEVRGVLARRSFERMALHVRHGRQSMFTGIVERMGKVAKLVRSGASVRLGIDAGPLGLETRIGDSVAVDGVCLTVANRLRREAGWLLEFDVVRETLERTTLGELRVGERVDLERSLTLSDRVGGHLVTGHVDGVGTVRAIRKERGQVWLTVECNESLEQGMLFKGSIAVSGVSLTIAALEGTRFSVALVPHTLDVTKLGRLEVGDRVNLETDQIGKWVRKLLEESGSLSPAVAIRRSRRAPR